MKAADLTRAEAFVADLQAELAEVDRCQAVAATIIAELATQSSAKNVHLE